MNGGHPPETWHAVSPHRVEFQLALINDWIPDNPITIAARALLPEWLRWHSEQAGLPMHLIDRGVAVTTIASGRHRTARVTGFNHGVPLLRLLGSHPQRSSNRSRTTIDFIWGDTTRLVSTRQIHNRL